MKQFLKASVGIFVVLCGFAVEVGMVRSAEHTRDSLQTVKASMAARRALLVDVRERFEWNEGHLRDASLLPLSELPGRAANRSLQQQYPRGLILYIHCASGIRCREAADILRSQGYDARPLREGYQTLLRNGFPGAK